MPSSKGYKRNYKQENVYKSQPSQVKKRVERNQARADALKQGTVHKGDNKQVDHIKPLSKGGSNSKANRRVVSAQKNESFPRTKTGAMLHQNFALGPTAIKRKRR